MSVAATHEPWNRIRAELRRSVGASTYALWLEDLEVQDVRDGEIVLLAPAENRAWIVERYDRLLGAVAARVLGPETRVTVVAAALPAPTPPTRSARTDGSRGGARGGPPRADGADDRAGFGSADGAASPGSRAGAAAAAVPPAELELNPRHTFEQFVIGDSNRLAHAACLSVAEMPGLAYNPLYLCGAPGLGKTHLLQSIAAYLRDYGNGLRVRYATVEAFTNQFLASLHGRNVDAFKAAYREIDVLLVDDVQFLERKAKTEEEFFHTFNALHAAGAQVVLSSDRPPRDLDGLEDRLRERFESGLVCEIQPPDPETRLTILRKRVHQDGLDHVEPAALEVVADRVDHNIRLLEGALIRIVAYASLTGARVNAPLATEVLDGAGVTARHAGAHGPPRAGLPVVDIPAIQRATSATLGVPVEDLVGAGRTTRVAFARQVGMYLARELTNATLPAIGDAFGKRNHSTVINACKRTAERIAVDPEAFAVVQRLTAQLRAGTGNGTP